MAQVNIDSVLSPLCWLSLPEIHSAVVANLVSDLKGSNQMLQQLRFLY